MVEEAPPDCQDQKQALYQRIYTDLSVFLCVFLCSRTAEARGMVLQNGPKAASPAAPGGRAQGKAANIQNWGL